MPTSQLSKKSAQLMSKYLMSIPLKATSKTLEGLSAKHILDNKAITYCKTRIRLLADSLDSDVNIKEAITLLTFVGIINESENETTENKTKDGTGSTDTATHSKDAPV